MANPFFSGRIPQELHQRIEEYIKSTGKTKTQLLVEALSTYVGIQLSVDNKAITDNYDRRLSDIEERLKALEDNVITSYQSDNKAVNSPSHSNEWLTTGEAYEEAQRQGYSKSIGTFRRSLSGGEIPAELSQVGLQADFEARNQGNPKDNSIRWLKLTRKL